MNLFVFETTQIWFGWKTIRQTKHLITNLYMRMIQEDDLKLWYLVNFLRHLSPLPQNFIRKDLIRKETSEFKTWNSMQDDQNIVGNKTISVNFCRIYDHNVNISSHRLGEDWKVRVWLETNVLPTNHTMQVLEMATIKMLSAFSTFSRSWKWQQ